MTEEQGSTKLPNAKRLKVESEVSNRYQTVDLKIWLQNSAHERLPLVDLRSNEDFEKRHLQQDSSTIVHLPFGDLLSGERSCELPPRHVEFAILVPSQVEGKEIEDFFFATVSKATSQSRKPWLVRQIIQETENIWREAERLEIMSTVSADAQSLPLPRLWKPDQMVEHKLLPMLGERLQNSLTEDNFLVWDLGSGAGRDVCFLAEELKYIAQKVSAPVTINVVGFDNHKGSARRSLPLWKNRMVNDCTESRLVNLKKLDVLENNIKNEQHLECIYTIRYLNRRMLEYIATQAPLRVGCLFAISHFCKEQGGGWNWEHPKPNSVLERDELRKMFNNERGWGIIHDEMCLDGDHGRTLINFCVEKI